MSGTRQGASQQGARGRAPALAFAAVAMLALGVLIGRATTAPAPAPAPAPSQPTAQGAGPSRLQDGVPVGYARTEAGAVAAAAQYVAAFDGERGLIEEERLAVLDVIAADDTREQLATQMSAGTALIAEQLGVDEDVARDPGFVSRSVVAGYELTAHDADQAMVAVWATSIFFAEGRQAISGIWTTETVTLRWERDDWRLVTFESEEGPTPPDTPTPAVPQIGRDINAFERFAHVPASQ